MITQSGCNIVHASELLWEECVRADGGKYRTKTYWHDTENNLILRLLDQPANAVAPIHAESGALASVVLKGRALRDGLTLDALDVIIGSGIEPHGPLTCPDSSGCQLFSCLQVTIDPASPTEKPFRIIQSAQTPWDAKAGGALHMKPLVTEGAGRLMLTAMRLSAGFTVPVGSRPHMQAAVVVEGAAVVGTETLRAGDFMYMAAGVPHGPISFPDGATLLMVAMRAA